MHDGNFIVMAGYRPTIAFKCHQSVLANHSTIFADMFSLPPSPQTETYQGLFKVYLHDHPDDVRELLAILYYPTYV